MTAQIHDKLNYNNRLYDLVGAQGDPIFTPEDFTLSPIPASTACWRGYQCIYTVQADRLILDQLFVNLHPPHSPPPINGVHPTATSSPFSHHYEHLNLPIPFTGTLQIATDFIPSLYAHMGFHPPWKYETVLELIFEKGILRSVRDISAQMRALRDKLTTDTN